MGIPLRQKAYVSAMIIRQLLAGHRKFPLVLMLEPLFRCNLRCRGCGKIKRAGDTVDLDVDACLAAAEECGAPIVSIAGGEPLLHPDMPAIVDGLIKNRRFVYLCTNALLLEKRMDEFQPSTYFSFNVHLDGLRKHHDGLVGRQGTFDQAVSAIRMLTRKGFRVTTNTTLFLDVSPEETVRFFDFLTELGVEGMTVAPGFNFETALDPDHFLTDRAETRKRFSDIFAIGKNRGWKFNHSSLYLDFLAGGREYQCTPWGNPTYNHFGWQRPCYLLDDGYATSFADLMENTDWEAYGVGRNPKCGACMVHSGFEASAVMDMLQNPLQSLRFQMSKHAEAGL